MWALMFVCEMRLTLVAQAAPLPRPSTRSNDPRRTPCLPRWCGRTSHLRNDSCHFHPPSPSPTRLDFESANFKATQPANQPPIHPPFLLSPPPPAAHPQLHFTTRLRHTRKVIERHAGWCAPVTAKHTLLASCDPLPLPRSDPPAAAQGLLPGLCSRDRTLIPPAQVCSRPVHHRLRTPTLVRVDPAHSTSRPCACRSASCSTGPRPWPLQRSLHAGR